MTTAGHVFTEQIEGTVCACGRRWVDISGVTRADIGQPHIAHVGTLNEREFEEIVAKRERDWRAAMGRREREVVP
jgi:hypothetical protein